MVRDMLLNTAILAAAGTGSASAEGVQPHRLSPIPIRQVTIQDDFWSPNLKLWREVTIPDCFAKFENDRGGAIHNFDLVRDGKTGHHAGPQWYDGLIYEMITGSADFLAARRDPALEARLDGYIARIVAAQARDSGGYVNTWTQTLGSQSQRWGMNGGDDRGQHDIYNAGMMIEAGVHYYRATGKPALLEAATRMADLMCDTIGPPPRANVIPGHSGPEEALVALYRLYHDTPQAKLSVHLKVDENRYLALAEYFIEARGRYEGRTSGPASFGEYCQDHAPLAQQKTIEGHAVRATLFCTGIAAAAYVNDRPDYMAAANRLWDSFVGHRMYITGGAGAIAADEKFGPDYTLPNDGYMETCGAVGGGFFDRNMNLLFGHARYVDELERVLYNAALGGCSLDGTRYYYQNPLVGEGLRRWEWHPCPCCPPMFLKIMGALPGYVYARDNTGVYVNLFVGSRAEVDMPGGKVALEQTTRYPWDGKVTVAVRPERPAEFDLFVRIPGWCQGASSPDDLYEAAGRPVSGAATIRVNGRYVKLDIARGYARLHRRWKAGDIVELRLAMPVRQVHANPMVEADRGRVALMRGPVVYCAESVDNPAGIGQLVVPPDATFHAEYKPDLLGGVAVLHGPARTLSPESSSMRKRSAELTLIPFYASANRDPCAMAVWLPASGNVPAAHGQFMDGHDSL